MSGGTDRRLFALVRGFLADYLPQRRNCSANTIRSYRTGLDQFLTHVAGQVRKPLAGVTFADITRDSVNAFLDSLESDRHCSIQTRNHRLNGIRSFVSYAAMEDIAVVAVKQDLDGVPMKKTEVREVVGHLTEPEVETLLRTPDTTTRKGRRDRAMLVFMYDTGARVQETAGTRISDLDLGDRPAVTLRGKGRKTRIVPLMGNTVKILAQYTGEFHRGMPHGDGTPLFYTVRNGVRRRMTEDNIRKLVHSYGEKALCGQSGGKRRLHPHMLRHTRAMHLYQNGMGLELLSQWLGHAQIETTLIYAHADAEMKRKAIAEATPPESPLGKHVKPERMKENDDDLIRRLYGLR